MWLTTDTDVACVLRITDTRLNVTRTYSLLDAFLLFPAITVSDWHKMTMPPRMERINAFKGYINEVESVDIAAIQTNEVFRHNEMPVAPATGWILATGFWNDNGYWDDTAQWPH
jgi:hypothetical protein